MTQNGYISLHFLRRRENTGGISVSNICATFSRIEAFGRPSLPMTTAVQAGASRE